MNAWTWLPLCIFLLLMSVGPPASADTIVFQNPKTQQHGTVVSEDDSSVTIRFPKSAIKSITMAPGEGQISEKTNQVIIEEKDGYQIVKIPNHLLRIRSSSSQKNLSKTQPTTVQPGPNVDLSLPLSETPTAETPRQPHSIQGKLFEEEMGRAQGTILWHGQPLQGTVKIVMTKYTGFSFATMKSQFSSDPNATFEQSGIILATQTDSHGHYSFARVPPGNYRLYWEPAGETDYYHRLRDKPDLVVVSGKMTTQNIPGNGN